MAQSRVSRHLAILRKARLLSDRRDGTYVFYRFSPPSDELWRQGWALVEEGLAGDSSSERDDTVLRRVMDARSGRTRNFFDAVGPEWDSLRKVFNDDTLRARAIDRLVTPGLRVADVGTGTGILACELARLGLDVIGIDSSEPMLETAREKLAREEFRAGGCVEFKRGEADRIPLGDAEVDAAFAHMVLHYVASPGDVIRDMARIIRPGGVLVIVDFVRHAHEWMEKELGVLWMGFEADEIRSWFGAAGLPKVNIEEVESLARDRDLPGTLIASARLPSQAGGPS